MTLADFPFPQVNATLNGTCAVLLIAAYAMIRRGRVRAHATLMIIALLTSAAFLASYLTYHIHRAMHHGVITRFPAGTVWRPIYLTILNTHTLLAVIILPMIVVTVWRAAHRQWDRHRQIAVWALPIWLYVSVTGVIIYWMLYHLAPRLTQ